MFKELLEIEAIHIDLTYHSEHVLLILNDFLNEYDFVDFKPTKKEAEKLMLNAESIVRYMNIARNIVFEIKNSLNNEHEHLYTLFDKVKKLKETTELDIPQNMEGV